MRSTLFNKILDETTVEVDLPRGLVIERLYQLQGPCTVSDSAGDRLQFFCEKSGRFSFGNIPTRSTHRAALPRYVAGEVLEKNGKTVVKIHTVQHRGGGVALAVVLGLDLILLLLYLLFDFSVKTAPLILFLFGSLIVPTLLSYQNKQTGTAIDTELMKKEVTNRIEAVKRWDE